MRRLLAALLLLGGCDPGKPETRALVWARGTDSTTLDPAEVEWGEDAKITQNLYETLVAFKPDSVELEGRLATHWEFSPDGKRLTFDLRRGATFHDGTPFDAEAVVFSFARLTDPAHPHRPRAAPYAPSFSGLESVTADGPSRVVFSLKQPSAVILQNLALFCAAIVSPAAVRKHGKDFAQNPCGTGPYRLARWDRDVKIVLDRFEDYWGTRPPVGRVIVVPVQSPQSALQQLRKGSVHVVDHPPLADVKPLQDDPATHVDTETSMNVCYLGFNLKKQPYSDLNFRRAVSLAIDRGMLNTLVYHDLAQPASNLVPPAIWKDLCPTPGYDHNPEKAKELLAKANLATNKVELIHMTFARPYVPEPQRVAEFVKDQLRRIGLEVKLSGYDKAAYTLKTREEDHPMFLLGWNADFPDPHNFLHPLLHGDNAGDLNASFFDDPDFNRAITQAHAERDPSERAALYAKAYAHYRDRLPTIPLVHVRQIIGLARGIGYDMHPLETRFYNASFTE